MAIKSFKDIINKRGYKVSKTDRAIFEKEIGKSYFGMGISDMIEFIVYDSNDNQLPQGETGKLVRYINIDAENIRKYFLITENPSNRRLNGASEYIIDVEKLLIEAGYSNGSFKTQVTLLNRRVGSEDIAKDKLWIHEISPSRTEIRVLPLEDEKEQVYADLQKRLDIMLNNKNFRDDTIYFVRSMVESIKVDEILKSFVTLNGTVQVGENYVKLIQAEFKINNWQTFINTLREKLVEGAQYFIENRNWDISSTNYGKPLSTPIDLELSVNKIVETLNAILIKVIDKYLPKRNEQEDNILTVSEQQTLDQVKQITKTVTSNTAYATDAFQNQIPASGSNIPNESQTITKKWYGWAPVSNVSYKDKFNKVNQTKIYEYGEETLTYIPNSILVEQGGDIREIPKKRETEQSSPNTSGTPTNPGLPPTNPSSSPMGGGATPTGTTSTGGGASGQTTTTGAGAQENQPGETRTPRGGIEEGTRPRGANN